MGAAGACSHCPGSIPGVASMQGQNVTVKVYRAAQLADDAAGGAQRGAYAQVYETRRARIYNRPSTVEMRAQGLQTDKLYDAFYQPATDGVVALDIIIPQTGPYAHARFLVTGVIGSSLENWSSPRAHLKLQLERYDSGKVLDLQ